MCDILRPTNYKKLLFNRLIQFFCVPEILSVIDDFHFFFHRRRRYDLLVQSLPCTIWTPALSLILIFTPPILILLLVSCMTLTYTCFSYSKFQISYPFSVPSVIPEDFCKSEVLLNISQQGTFYGELFLRLRPTHELEDLPSSAVRGFLFRIFAAAPHLWRLFPHSAAWGRAVPWWQGVY